MSVGGTLIRVRRCAVLLRSVHPPSILKSFWLIGVLLLAACQGGTPALRQENPSQPSASTGPKRLTAAVRSSPQILFYNKLNLASAGLGVSDFEKLLAAGLTLPDQHDVLRSQLAEVVPTLDNGLWKLAPDGRMETTWTIRPGAQWHDGTPFTTADLLFTAQVVQDRDLAAFADSAFDVIEQIDAVDARTLRVVWKGPFVEADSLFSYTHAVPLPKHLLERAYLEEKATFVQHAYWGPQFVGTGAFKLREAMQGSHYIFDANDHYALGRPRIDTIEVRILGDPNVVISNLLAGAAEYVFDSRSLSFEGALQARDQWTGGTMQLARGAWVTMFPQQLTPTPAAVADAQFRRGLIMAVDRQALVDTIQAGLSAVAHTYIHPTQPEYGAIEGEIVKHDFDLGRATQALAGAGYRRGAGGSFVDPAGQRLEVELRTTQTSINIKSTAAVADYWQQFGVGVEQHVVPQQRALEREYRATFPAFELIRPGASLTSFRSLHSSEIPLLENSWVGGNRSRYRSAELDGLIDRYFTTIPRDARIQVLARIIHQITDLQLLMGLFYDPDAKMVGNRLQNVIPGTLWNVHEWDIRQP